MKLAVFFPGIGYTFQKPLLYYSEKLAAAHGFDIVRVSYTGFPDNIRGAKDKMEESISLAWTQTVEQLKDVDFSKYEGDNDCIIFFSKSIGTIMAARYAMEKNLLAGQVYYTPLEATFPYIKDGYGIAFHGDKDPWAATDKITEGCAEKHIELYTIPDANHSLETGDVINDIDFIADVMETTEGYISDYE